MLQNSAWIVFLLLIFKVWIHLNVPEIWKNKLENQVFLLHNEMCSNVMCSNFHSTRYCKIIMHTYVYTKHYIMKNIYNKKVKTSQSYPLVTCDIGTQRVSIMEVTMWLQYYVTLWLVTLNNPCDITVKLPYDDQTPQLSSE